MYLLVYTNVKRALRMVCDFHCVFKRAGACQMISIGAPCDLVKNNGVSLICRQNVYLVAVNVAEMCTYRKNKVAFGESNIRVGRIVNAEALQERVLAQIYNAALKGEFLVVTLQSTIQKSDLAAGEANCLFRTVRTTIAGGIYNGEICTIHQHGTIYKHLAIQIKGNCACGELRQQNIIQIDRQLNVGSILACNSSRKSICQGAFFGKVILVGAPSSFKALKGYRNIHVSINNNGCGVALNRLTVYKELINHVSRIRDCGNNKLGSECIRATLGRERNAAVFDFVNGNLIFCGIHGVSRTILQRIINSHTIVI